MYVCLWKSFCICCFYEHLATLEICANVCVCVCVRNTYVYIILYIYIFLCACVQLQYCSIYVCVCVLFCKDILIDLSTNSQLNSVKKIINLCMITMLINQTRTQIALITMC